MDGDAMDLRQVRSELIKPDLALGRDACLNPACHVRQLTMVATITPRKRRKGSGLATLLDQIVTDLGDTRKCRAASRYP